MDEGESDCSPGRVITLRAETGYRTPFILLLSSLSLSLAPSLLSLRLQRQLQMGFVFFPSFSLRVHRRTARVESSHSHSALPLSHFFFRPFPHTDTKKLTNTHAHEQVHKNRGAYEVEGCHVPLVFTSPVILVIMHTASAPCGEGGATWEETCSHTHTFTLTNHTTDSKGCLA